MSKYKPLLVKWGEGNHWSESTANDRKRMINEGDTQRIGVYRQYTTGYDFEGKIGEITVKPIPHTCRVIKGKFDWYVEVEAIPLLYIETIDGVVWSVDPRWAFTKI